MLEIPKSGLRPVLHVHHPGKALGGVYRRCSPADRNLCGEVAIQVSALLSGSRLA
jgi:hypothetical protein